MENEPSNIAPAHNRRFQFSLRSLLIFIVAASLALAAMRFATDAWTTAVASVTILSLLFSVVLAVYARPFCVGFVICCGGYLLALSTPIAQSFTGGRLFTTQITTYLCDAIHPKTDYSFAEPRGVPIPGGGGYTYPAVALPPGKIGTSQDYAKLTTNFSIIAHLLWSLILGAFGGMLAEFAAGRRARQNDAFRAAERR